MVSKNNYIFFYNISQIHSIDFNYMQIMNVLVLPIINYTKFCQMLFIIYRSLFFLIVANYATVFQM